MWARETHAFQTTQTLAIAVTKIPTVSTGLVPATTGHNSCLSDGSFNLESRRGSTLAATLVWPHSDIGKDQSAIQARTYGGLKLAIRRQSDGQEITFENPKGVSPVIQKEIVALRLSCQAKVRSCACSICVETPTLGKRKRETVQAM